MAIRLFLDTNSIIALLNENAEVIEAVSFNDDVEDIMFGFAQMYRSFSLGEGEGG